MKHKNTEAFVFTPDASGGLHCIHCGTANPDGGDACGNCGLDPLVPEKDETFNFNPSLFFRRRKVIKRV